MKKLLFFLPTLLAMLWHTNVAAADSDYVEYDINKTKGTFTGGGDYHAEWTSSASGPTYRLKVVSGANNMNYNGDNIGIYTGSSASSCAYRLEAEIGYNVVGFSCKARNAGSTAMTITTPDGTAYSIASGESVDISYTNQNLTTITFTQGAVNQQIVLENMKVFIATAPPSTTAVPVKGRVYYIGALIDKNNDGNYSHYYIRNESGTTFAWPESNAMDEANQWICEGSTTAGKLNFRNVKTGKYLKHKGLQDAAYNFTVADQSSTFQGYASIYSDADNRYLVAKEATGWDQATGLFNPHSTAYTTYYRFTDIAFYASVHISTNMPTGAVFMNGSEELSSYDIAFEKGSANITLSIKPGSYDATLFTFEGFYDGNGTSLGSTYTVPTNTNENITVTARFSSNIISANYGEKWLRLSNVQDNAHCATLYTEGSAKRAKTQTLDFSMQEQLWCFVGNIDGFRVYNMATGNAMAMTIDAAAAAESGTFQMQAANDENASKQLWKLASVNGNFCIESTTLAGQGWNPLGGVGNQLKFWRTSGTGTQWLISSAPATAKTVNVTFNERSLASVNNTKMGALTIVSDGKTGTTAYTLNSFADNTTIASNLYVNGGTIAYNSQDYDGYTVTLNGTALGTTAVELGDENNVEFHVDENSRAVYVYYNSENPGGVPFRIPALATFPDGTMLAVTDMRTCGNDIGFGRVDLWCKTSTDNGRNWGENQIIVEGNGTTAANATDENPLWKCGFGDAALCVDGNDILLMCVGGRAVYSSGSATNRNAMVRIRGTYNPATKTITWGEPENQSQQFFDLLPSNAYTMFIGSGRLFQSRVTRAAGAEHNRIYAALLCLNNGNIVVYSDDFGATWNILGSASDRPAPGGNEPKCEELPDGSVILSSRNPYKRIFNVFTYSDESKTTGTWDSPVAGLAQNDGPNGTNGDIFYTTVTNPDNSKMKHHYMLQSVPAGPGRSNVKVYRKRIDPNTTYTSATFATGWEEAVQVSTKSSGYSAITQLNDGSFGVFYEEVPGGYSMVYKNYSNEEMLGEQNWSQLVPLSELYDAVAPLVHPTNPGSIYSDDLATALANAKTLIDNMNEDEAAIDAAITAINTAKSAITEPNRFVVGKWYQFVNMQQNGNEYVLIGTATGMNAGALSSNADNEATYYYCAREVDTDKFAFVNGVHGNYMAPRTSDGKGVGASSTYDVRWCGMEVYYTLGHSFAGAGSFAACSIPQNGFMLYALGRSANYPATSAAINITSTGGFDGWSNRDYFYAPGYSTIFRAIEVEGYCENLNNVTFRQPAEADGNSYATFYANYPVEMPEGATAYVCDQASNGSLHLTAIEGSVVPARTAVVITGATTLGNETLQAALMDVAPTIGTNLLIGTLTNTTVGDILSEAGNSGKTLFGLNGAFGKIGFFQTTNTVVAAAGRAFYIGDIDNAGSQTGVRGFTFSINGDADAIEAPKAATSTVIYDLTGRRVNKTERGNLYIINGKKQIAK